MTLTHVGSSVCLDDRVKPGKQGQPGTQVFQRRQRSGADFSQLMFSDAADPSAKTTPDLWPSLSHAHTHNRSSALHRATLPPSSPVRVADRSGGVRLLAAGPVPRSPTLLLKDKQSQPISESGRPPPPRPLPSLSPPRARATRTLTALMSHFGALKKHLTLIGNDSSY